MRFGRHPSGEEVLRQAQGLLTSGRWGEYLALTRRAVERFPDDPDLRLEHATALQDAEPEQARREALHAVSLDQAGDAVRLTRAAGVLLAVGDLTGAQACVDNAVRAGSSNAIVINKLSSLQGEIAVKRGNLQAAETYLRAAHEAEPEDASYARDLAAVLAAQGRFGDALNVIDRSLPMLASPIPDTVARDRAMLDELRAHVERALRDAEPGRLA
jgi:Flp pilus assembly protein TadD